VIEVYVKRSVVLSDPSKIKTLSHIYCIQKGEIIQRLKDPFQEHNKNSRNPTSMSDHEGVLIFWVEETSNQPQTVGGKKSQDSGAEGAAPSISAKIGLTFVGFDKNEFRKTTKVIQVKHKKDLQWELGS
jgi:hypothetical protein